MKSKLLLASIGTALAFVSTASSQTEKPSNCLPVNSKIYISQLPGDFNKFMTDALEDGHAKLVIVTARDKADFEIRETVEEIKSEGPATFVNHSGSAESVNMSVVNVKTDIVIFSGWVSFSSASNQVIARSIKRSAANNMARALRDKMKKDAKGGCSR